MNDEIRQKYLKEEWQPFPSVPEGVLSVRQIHQKWLQMINGKDRAKTPTFYLGGRLQFTPDAWQVEAEGDKIEIIGYDSLNLENEKSALELLRVDDLILAQAQWSDVIPDSDSHRIRSVKFKSIRLLVPTQATFRLNSDFTIRRSRQWNLFLKLIREALRILDFVEVRTPNLVRSPGLEPFLDPFITHLEWGSKKRNFYLPTSPEFHLKKMLALGWRNIYEIKDCYRNGEISETHQPEFAMLEWYRAFSPLSQIQKDIQGIFNYLKLHWPEPIRNLLPLQAISMKDLFHKKIHKILTPRTSRDELKAWASELGVGAFEQDTWDDLFFKIFLEKIEPGLGANGPLMVTQYPPSQSALARLTDDGWADRFELYWKGFELANAFHELNDPAEQRRRFAVDIEAKIRLGKTAVPIDDEFLRALDHGLPPSAGIALGLDRLFMALIEVTDIGDTRAFPQRPLES